MSDHSGALALAAPQVAAVRDDPAARLALMSRVFHGPTGRAPRHLPFRRAALSIMRWQARRGVLNPLDATPPGSVWWRAVNERLLHDGCETIALLGGSAGEPSSQAVQLWLEFGARPTGRKLVSRAQRERRGRLPGASRARRSGGRAGALLHERRAGAGDVRPRSRGGAGPGARAARSARPRARRSPARDGRRLPRVAQRADAVAGRVLERVTTAR